MINVQAEDIGTAIIAVVFCILLPVLGMMLDRGMTKEDREAG